MTTMQILWSGNAGGAEKLVYDLIKFSRKNHFNHFVMIMTNGNWLIGQLEKAQGTFYVMDCKRLNPVGFYNKLFTIIKKISPDIIQVHTRNFLLNCFLLFYNGKKLYFEHGGYLYEQREHLFYKLFAKTYHSILTNSDFVSSYIINTHNLNSKKIKKIRLGVDLNDFSCRIKKVSCLNELKIPHDYKIVGAICRLVEQKGVYDFLRVANEIQKRYGKVSFVIVGEGYLREEILKLAKNLKINLILTGERNDVNELLSIFNVYLFTSKLEPFGISLIEALASGVPVIGYKIPGAAEIFDVGGGGILIENRNPIQLAELIIHFLDSTDIRKKYIDEGILNARNNFNIINTINHIESFYTNVIAGTDEDSSCK